MTQASGTQSDLLKGKRGLVMGVANDRSIGWGIAKAAADAGAELAFTFRAKPLRSVSDHWQKAWVHPWSCLAMLQMRPAWIQSLLN